MAKGRQRQRVLQVTDRLYLGPNCTILKKSGNDYEEVDLTELAVLDGLTATTAELNILDGVTSTAAELNILDGVTATAAEINEVCDKSALHEVVTTTNVLTAAESGKHCILNSATGFVSTLPAPAIGLEFYFHVGATVPTSGNHTVVTDSSANIIVGNICSPEDAAGSVSVVQDADTISFVANLALHGDHAYVYSDGTNWYLSGMCAVQDGMTTTQAS